MDYSGAILLGVAAVAALWALLFIPPWFAAWRERQQFAKLERVRRRQYAAVERRQAD